MKQVERLSLIGGWAAFHVYLLDIYTTRYCGNLLKSSTFIGHFIETLKLDSN